MISTTVIEPEEQGYKSRINRIPDKPQRLFLRGSHDFNRPAVAIVGSRKHSAYGTQVTKRLAGDLARMGVVIVSGLALGIDGLAHAAALEAGGQTTAVMPGGLETAYPASHRTLAARILESGGGLISEYPDGTHPQNHFFVARNRVVAGLSDAVLVIEAARKSGTLITAEFALDMGIPVLAVPGPITSPSSAGTNRLIQIGASLITSAAEVLQEIGLEASGPKLVHVARTPLDAQIIDALQAGPSAFEQLAATTGLGPPELARKLTHLELSGSVSCLGNNMWGLR